MRARDLKLPAGGMAVAGLVAAPIILLAPLLLCPACAPFPPGGAFSDLLLTHLPNAEYWRAALFQHGQWPLWNAQLFAGQPFAADPLAGIWYPPNLLLLVLPLPWGFSVLLAAHLAWAGLGLFRFLRAEGLAAGPAFFGALALQATPKLLAHLGAGHFSLVCAVAWTPWVLLAIRPLRGAPVHWRAGLRAGALAGAALAAGLLADPRWAFYTAALAAAFWLTALPPFTRPRPVGRDLAAALGLTSTFLLLSAVLVLPLFVFVTRSNRTALSLADGALFSLPPLYLVGLFIPDLGGFHEWLTYLGVAPLWLAVLGGAARRLWFWGAAAASAAGFALGANFALFPLLFRVLPGLGYLRVPPRAWFIVALAVAVMGAHGLHFLVSEAWPRLQASPRLPRLRRTLPPARVVLAAVIGLTAADLWRVDLTLWEARPRPVRAPAAEWIAAQRAPAELFRVYSPSYSLPLDDGLEHVDGVNPLQLADSARFIAAAAGVPLRGYSVTLPRLDGPEPAVANAGAAPDAERLGLLNVKYVAAEFSLAAPELRLAQTFGRTRVYENLAWRPRAWMDTGAPAAVVSWSPNRIVIRAEGPGRLTLSEINYPGWQAAIDGAPAGLETVAGLLRGVAVPAGPHTITFDFRPPSVFWGLGLTALGLAGLAGVLRWTR